MSESTLIDEQVTCEEATHVTRKQEFSIAIASIGKTKVPKNLARAMRHVAIELGSK